jgi:hypothetical protein
MEIVRYQVPKQHVLEKDNPSRAPEAATERATAPTAGSPSRTLAAIVLHGPAGWFFKLTGPPEAVEVEAERFDAFIRSLKFEAADGPPEWTLPEGWVAQPAEGLRYATLLIQSAQPPLELAISTLRGPEAGQEQSYLLANINRWRGQVQLPPITAEELDDQSRRIELDGFAATVVDLTGKTSGGGMGQPPFTARTVGEPPPEPGQVASPPAIRATVPDNWRAGKAGVMRKAAYDVTEGDRRIEITVIDLPKTDAPLLSQVNRWRGQVGLDEISEAELQQQVQELPLGAAMGHYVEALGSEQAVLAVVAERDGTERFFKLMGDRELAERERDHFRAFVQSAELSDAKEAPDGP